LEEFIAGMGDVLVDRLVTQESNDKMKEQADSIGIEIIKGNDVRPISS
jgi:hypothetical protein